MRDEDIAELVDDLRQAVEQGATQVGILGHTATVPRLVHALDAQRRLDVLVGVFAPDGSDTPAESVIPVLGLEHLTTADLDVLVVASDEQKVELLLDALPHVRGVPKVLVAGYGHHRYGDSVYLEELIALEIPSLANGTRTASCTCINASRTPLASDSTGSWPSSG